MTNKTKRVALAMSTALAFGGVMVPTNAFAETSALSEDLTLNDNITNCYTVEAGKSVTIDLNGHDITCNGAHAIAVNNGAKVTIKGTGTVSAESGSFAAVFNDHGNVTIEGGTYNSANWYTLKNMGAMTINGGTFTQGAGNTSNSSLIVNGWYNGKGTNGNDKGVAHEGDEVATMTINGGTFDHAVTTTSDIKSDDYSKTVINDGSFTSKNGYLVQATGDVTVNNGIFKGYNSMIVFNANGEALYEPGTAVINNGDVEAKYIATGSKGVLSVKGGTFKGLEGVKYSGTIKANDGSDGLILGGKFDKQPDAKYIAEGKAAYYDNAGAYEVSDKAAPVTSVELDTNEVKLAKGGRATVKLSYNEDFLTSSIQSVVCMPKNWTEGESWPVACYVGASYDVLDIYGVSQNGSWDYTVTVKDINGESASADFTITVEDALERGGVSDGQYNAWLEFAEPIEGGDRIEMEGVEIPEKARAEENNLVAVFDIKVVDQNGDEIAVSGNEITITLWVKKSLVNEDDKYFQIVYINKSGNVMEWFDPEVEEYYSGYSLTFTTSHLSNYGVIASSEPIMSAENKNALHTPETGVYTATGGSANMSISGVAFVASVMTALVALAGAVKLAKARK